MAIVRLLGDGSNYGGKPTTLAQQSKLPVNVVEAFQPKYFSAFPAHLRWQEAVESQLRRYGNLTSLTNRRRWFFGRRSDPAVLREAIAYDPQCSLADIVNTALLNIWRKDIAIIMMHDHDALTFQYPEEKENEVLSSLHANLIVPINLADGRVLSIPYDCKVGWNRGDYDEQKNIDGLKDWNGNDTRRRTPAVDLMDRIIRRSNR